MLRPSVGLLPPSHWTGVGAGLGVMFGSLINGAARNPNIAKQLVGYALLGFALTESIALFSLLVVFLILFA